MNWLMPITTTATEIQRNYKKVRNKAKKAKAPVTVLANNKPELVVIDYQTFTEKYGDQKRFRNVKTGDNFDEFCGVWSKQEADEFDRVIEEAFEQINPEDWK